MTADSCPDRLPLVEPAPTAFTLVVTPSRELRLCCLDREVIVALDFSTVRTVVVFAFGVKARVVGRRFESGEMAERLPACRSLARTSLEAVDTAFAAGRPEAKTDLACDFLSACCGLCDASVLAGAAGTFCSVRLRRLLRREDFPSRISAVANGARLSVAGTKLFETAGL